MTTGGNKVPCVAGTPNCVNGMLGYAAGAGYDLATGLGSLDIFNLVVAWGADQYFATVDRGGYLATTNDVSSNFTVGYATIETLDGQASPSGIAIYGYRSNGILVSEAGVPASPAIHGARIYAEVAGAIDTGVAVANPNSQPATISFYFTDPTGASVGTPGTFTIPANGQIAKFLDQAVSALACPAFWVHLRSVRTCRSRLSLCAA